MRGRRIDGGIGRVLPGALVAPATRPRDAVNGISRRYVLGGLVLGSLVLTPASLVGAAERPSAVDVEAEAAAALDLLNAYRQEQGLAALTRTGPLQAAAQAHADDLAAHNMVSHSSSDGTDAFSRIRRYYTPDTWLGENVAAGQVGAEALVQAWQQSAAHNENLLLADYQAVGLALAVNPKARYRWFWVCDLGGEVVSE